MKKIGLFIGAMDSFGMDRIKNMKISLM